MNEEMHNLSRVVVKRWQLGYYVPTQKTANSPQPEKRRGHVWTMLAGMINCG